MYYAKKVNDLVVRCNISDEVPPGTTFNGDPTEEQLAQYGVFIVHDSPSLPEHDETTHGLVDIQPILQSDGKWYAQYTVVVKAPETPPPTPPSP